MNLDDITQKIKEIYFEEVSAGKIKKRQRF